MLLTVDNRGTAVIDLCDFPELGSFLDIGQQGIPSPSTTARLGLRALSKKKRTKTCYFLHPFANNSDIPVRCCFVDVHTCIKSKAKARNNVIGHHQLTSDL